MKAVAATLVAILLALPARADPSVAAESYFRGLSLVDQEGRTIDLYEDLMKDHVVVLNSFFTVCQGSCPLMAATFGYLQKRFDAQSLRLISISADPTRDTPAALKAYAEKVGAKDHWRFLTGTKAQVDRVLARLGQHAERPDAHSNLMIVGNVRTGLWKKALGLAKRDEIAAIVESVLDDRR